MGLCPNLLVGLFQARSREKGQCIYLTPIDYFGHPRRDIRHLLSLERSSQWLEGLSKANIEWLLFPHKMLIFSSTFLSLPRPFSHSFGIQTATTSKSSRGFKLLSLVLDLFSALGFFEKKS